MNKFFIEISQMLWGILIFAMLFVFYGEPDLWDKWHEAAMGGYSNTCVEAKREN